MPRYSPFFARPGTGFDWKSGAWSQTSYKPYDFIITKHDFADVACPQFGDEDRSPAIKEKDSVALFLGRCSMIK